MTTLRLMSPIPAPVLKGAGFVIVTYSVIKLLRSIWRYYKYFKFFNSIPGETDFHWLLGNTHKLSKVSEERLNYFNGQMLKYPRMLRFWFGPFQPLVILHHPDTMKTLIKTSEPKPRGLFGSYKLALPWLGEGLLLAGGARWARSRRLLTPAFHFDILKPYMEVYNKASDTVANKIQQYSDNGDSFELFGLISLCTLDIILQCAMSYNDNIQLKGDSHPYVKAVNELSHLWFERGRNPLLSPDWIYSLTRNGHRFLEQCRFVHSISEDIIEKRKKTLKDEGPPQKRYLDFLDILLTAKDENGIGLTPLEIRNEVDTFLFEGHDTTASAISWILYSLAVNPDIQREVQRELDVVLEDKEEHKIEWTDLPKLEYLTRVIKEGMRMHSPVAFIQRELTQPLEVDGMTIPVGTTCSLSLYHLHHNPTVWKDPWQFRPDRFLPENIMHQHHFAFVPFSAGPRNCIGQNFAMNEEKVVLSRILHRFTLEVDPNHEVRRCVAAVMRAENGIRVFAKSRVQDK